tara:strand:- start:1089 stop:1571 length:483 start_codon:yes stop_codon:yes gene_type:complete
MNLPPLNNVTTLMPTNMDADGDLPERPAAGEDHAGDEGFHYNAVYRRGFQDIPAPGEDHTGDEGFNSVAPSRDGFEVYQGLDRLMGIAANMNLQIDEMQRTIQRLIDEIKELKRNGAGPSKRQRPSGREAKAKQEAQAEPDGTLREVDFSGFRPQDDRRR